jgi:hypothetical protein
MGRTKRDLWLAAALAAAVLIGAIAQRAAADLVEVATVFGAATGTLDTSTGLIWLDVSVPTLLSYDDLLVEIQPGGLYENFHLATQVQVQTLWQNAGINLGEGFLGEFTSANYAPIVALAALVGQTDAGFNTGWIESGPGGNTLEKTASTSWNHGAGTGRPSFPQRFNVSDLYNGAWLLVPEPAPAPLRALALVTLCGLRAVAGRRRCGPHWGRTWGAVPTLTSPSPTSIPALIASEGR